MSSYKKYRIEVPLSEYDEKEILDFHAFLSDEYSVLLPNLTLDEVTAACKFLMGKIGFNMIEWGTEWIDSERARDFILLNRGKEPLGRIIDRENPHSLIEDILLFLVGHLFLLQRINIEKFYNFSLLKTKII